MSLLVLFAFTRAVAQPVAKNYTIIPFSDSNSNCSYDPGEPVLVNCPMQITSWPCYNMGASMVSDCSGMCTGALTVPVTCTTFSIQNYSIGSYLPPCNSYSAVPFNTVYYLPLNASILNSALFDATFGLVCNNQYNIIYQNGRIDTIKTCNAINAQFVTGRIRSQTGCYNTYTGTLSIKIDGVTYDSFAITGAMSNSITTSPAGTFTVSNNAFETDFSYDFNTATTLTSGGHMISAELTTFPGYSQPSKMEYYVKVDSCGQMGGTAYVDCNSNCTQDPGETYGAYNISHITLANSANSAVAYPDINGLYTLNLPAGTYTLTPYAAPGFSLCSPAPSTVNIVNAYTINYPYGLQQAGPITDDYATFTMLTNGVPGPGAVPGGSFDITIGNYMDFANTCGTSVPPTQLKVVLPPQVSYASTLPGYVAPAFVIPAATGDTIVWYSPNANDVHKVRVTVGTSVTMGSSYCVQSIIYPLSDGYPGNNISSVCSIYGGPFDPNSKTSQAPGMNALGDIPPATQDLTYTIEFQNLGTGPAVNVNINDTIDAQLDLSSLEVLTSSFPVQTQVNAMSRAVNFKFANINLPASVSNEPGSHGYVQYKLRLNPSLPVGSQIKNRAHIYFDYNSAITTNTTKNTIVSIVTGVSEQSTAQASVFPNPAKDAVYIRNANVKEVVVTDVLGHEVKRVGNASTVSMQDLPEGVYFMKITDLEGSSTQVRIVKSN